MFNDARAEPQPAPAERGVDKPSQPPLNLLLLQHGASAVSDHVEGEREAQPEACPTLRWRAASVEVAGLAVAHVPHSRSDKA
jgi:hypothetical protein